KPALFSANSEGACPSCNGAGVIYTDLGIMAGVTTTCEVCEGRRFDASVLDYKLSGKDISEVLAMPVTEAEQFFATGAAKIPAAHAILSRLADVGLGYLSLGQPLTTLSGGERQRLKLATHLAEKAHADWIIDLGPGAGHDGGRVVFEGTPADLVADRSTLTGRHLAQYVGLNQ